MCNVENVVKNPKVQIKRDITKTGLVNPKGTPAVNEEIPIEINRAHENIARFTQKYIQTSPKSKKEKLA